jgi:hypothetical protein
MIGNLYQILVISTDLLVYHFGVDIVFIKVFFQERLLCLCGVLCCWTLEGPLVNEVLGGISIFGEAPEALKDDVEVVNLKPIEIISYVYQQQVALELNSLVIVSG